MRRWVLLIVVILAVVLGLLVGILNDEVVTLDILVTSLQASLGLVVMAAFAIGLLLGVTAIWVLRVLPMQFRIKRLQREARQLQSAQQPSDSSSTGTMTPNRLSG